ncbi:ATP-dependent Lon protease [Microlunatus sagamiharensis]|uniref:Lon protease n=1 Tax=Microlunatus sagamiharensis TaxID=546874 RepID=A0A1H2MMX7_9ACTN|nr:endopeptidase La [Microlunatus sagamiharensis]SDU94569.1 ATP-dependent Lon protease [Microlunatus sagamiharensis]
MTTTELPVLFLNDLVVLPGMVVPVELDDATRAAVDAARAHSDGTLLVAPRLSDRYASYGVVASIVQLGRLQSGEPAAVLKADRRVRIGSGVPGPGTALWIEAEELDPVFETDEIRALAEEYRHLLVATLQRRDAWQVIDTVNKVTDPSSLADLAGYASWLSDEQKRELLETPYVVDRLRVLVEWVKNHIAETEVNDKIADDVREGMEKSQREFLLRQQLGAIRKELGEDEPEGADDYRGRVEAADLPDDVRKAALREVGKLERSSDQSPESGWIRTWLDTVLDLPWSTTTVDSTDIRGARAVLDADHHGLEDVKDRIVEYLAVRARRSQRGLELVGGRGSGAVMVLAGPPGVGKTSLGESVARALGRKFVRVALGGVRDEAEIRGHRRTYVGALPGRIVRAISEAGSMNPVVLLDEIDKVGSDYRGDPSSALLEVLDPAQNHTFRDHYLEVDLDLSDVLFLATANVVENIPQPLLDRMELVTLDGYTEADKVAIAREYLLPRQLERAALTADEVQIDDEALREIAADYTHEPGVRQLERLLAKALRKATTRLAQSEGGEGDEAAATGGTSTPLVVTRANLREFLGRPRFTPEAHERTSVPGVATGLAVTGMGGDTLFIEASVMPATEGGGKGGLTLTGQLGDVMKESAHIALSYVRAHAEQLGITDPSVLDRPIHVHVPAGAVPKDGPSAGVTMVTALTSMATGRPVRGEVGMTGEVTLNGRVLPIGGVKQKLLAAQRAGLTTVFVPARNAPDLDEVPGEVTDAVEVVLTTDVAELVVAALEPPADAAASPVAAAA